MKCNDYIEIILNSNNNLVCWNALNASALTESKASE